MGSPGVFIALGLAAALVVSWRLGQDANWDLRNYHWYAGYAWLEGRHGFDMVPAQTPSFYNPLLDVPLYVLGSRLPAVLAMGVWSLLHACGYVLLFFIAREFMSSRDRLRRDAAAAAVAAVGFFGAGGLSLLGTTFHDNLVGLGPLLALLVIARARDAVFSGPTRQAFAPLFLAGLAAGVAAGLKQPSVIWCFGLCLGFCVSARSPVHGLRLAFLCGLGMIAGFALGGGHWMWAMWKTYGNPMHPYFNHVFQSPFAAISDYRDAHFLAKSPGVLDRLLLPFRWIADPHLVGEIPLPGEARWRDFRIPVLYALALVLVPVAVLRGIGRPIERYLVAVALIVLAVWSAMFGIYRYLVALEALAPLVILVLLSWAPIGRRAQTVAAAGVLVLLQVTTWPGSWGRIAWTDRLVEVKAPSMAADENAMVLMAGYQPLSFVIPAFPPAVLFVRIQSNFIHPDSYDNGYIHLLRVRVAAHRGALYILSSVPDAGIADAAARSYGLAALTDRCGLVRSNLNEDLRLCRLRRDAQVVP